jgi:hypothetical protein
MIKQAQPGQARPSSMILDIHAHEIENNILFPFFSLWIPPGLLLFCDGRRLIGGES